MADKYDVSNFSTTSGSFPADALSDFDNILLENGDVYYITRQTNTADSMGHVTTVSETDYMIYGILQDITIKDRKIHEMGLAVPGNRKLYIKPSYTITSGGVSTTHEIKEGDIITDAKLFTGAGSTGQYRVVKIIRQWYEPGTEIYRTAIVQSINLDGST